MGTTRSLEKVKPVVFCSFSGVPDLWYPPPYVDEGIPGRRGVLVPLPAHTRGYHGRGTSTFRYPFDMKALSPHLLLVAQDPNYLSSPNTSVHFQESF